MNIDGDPVWQVVLVAVGVIGAIGILSLLASCVLEPISIMRL